MSDLLRYVFKHSFIKLFTFFLYGVSIYYINTYNSYRQKK